MNIKRMNKDEIENALKLLAFNLKKANASPIDLVICGGASLIIAGMISRTTRDVDVLGVMKELEDGRGKTVGADPLPENFLAAVRDVAAAVGLEEKWLNAGPRDLVKYGLPAGFIERLERRQYGEVLTVWLASRFDQIHFKLYAAADTGPGRHIEDIKTLRPTAAECETAARWVMTHDPSEGFRQMLKQTLEYLGYGDVAARV